MKGVESRPYEVAADAGFFLDASSLECGDEFAHGTDHHSYITEMCLMAKGFGITDSSLFFSTDPSHPSSLHDMSQSLKSIMQSLVRLTCQHYSSQLEEIGKQSALELRTCLEFAASPKQFLPFLCTADAGLCVEKAREIPSEWSKLWELGLAGMYDEFRACARAFFLLVNNVARDLPGCIHTQRRLYYHSAEHSISAIDQCLQGLADCGNTPPPRLFSVQRELQNLREEMVYQRTATDYSKPFQWGEPPLFPSHVLSAGPFYPTGASWNEEVTTDYVQHEARLVQFTEALHAFTVGPSELPAFINNDTATQRVRRALNECFWSVLSDQCNALVVGFPVYTAAAWVVRRLYCEVSSLAHKVDLITCASELLVNDPTPAHLHDAYHDCLDKKHVFSTIETMYRTLSLVEAKFLPAKSTTAAALSFAAPATTGPNHNQQGDLVRVIRALHERLLAVKALVQHSYYDPRFADSADLDKKGLQELIVWLGRGLEYAVCNGLLACSKIDIAFIHTVVRRSLVCGILAGFAKGVEALRDDDYPAHLQPYFKLLYPMAVSLERLSILLAVAQDMQFNTTADPQRTLASFKIPINPYTICGRDEFFNFIESMIEKFPLIHTQLSYPARRYPPPPPLSLYVSERMTCSSRDSLSLIPLS